MMKSNRNPVIDIAKGILIISLLYDHTSVFSFCAEMRDPVANFIEDSKYLFTVFFIQSFFLITGYCSSFNKKFLPFLWSNIKTLLIPMYVLGKLGTLLQQLILGQPLDYGNILPFANWFMGRGQWFIIALFFSKIIYWIFSRFNNDVQIAMIAVLYLLGIYCTVHFWAYTEYLNYQHVLLMLPFLFFDNIAKTYKDVIGKYLPHLAITGALLIFGENTIHWIFNVSIPVLDAGINVPYYYVPLHFLNAICVTALILWIAKKFQHHGEWLIRVGTYTLVFYLWNDPIHYTIVHLLQPLYNSTSLWHCIIFHSLSFSLCLLISYYISCLIYETRYLR